MTRVILALLLVAAALPPQAACAAGALTLKADAGLGGICRPGRWTPVRVSVENAAGAEDVAGELVVDWGDARVRRSVTLASPSRKQFELYIRTADVRDAMTVRLWSDGRELQAADVPVRVAGADELVTLCVAPATALAAEGAGCTATLAPEALPRSWRGYEAANEVVWRSGDAATLAGDQQTAFRRWQIFRQFDSPGTVAAPSAVAPLTLARLQARLVLAAYLLSIAALAFVSRRARLKTLAFASAFAALIAIASATVFAAGRFGRASGISVRHITLVRQFPGAGDSLISMRGLVEYPAFDAFELRPGLTDAAIEPARRSGGRVEHRFDDSGLPILSGVFGLGARRTFALEGVGSFRALDVSRRARIARVTNVSGVELTDCRFSPGFSVEDVGRLPPGASVEAEEVEGVEGATFACTMSGAAVDFTDVRRTVRSDGGVQIVFHLTPSSVANDRD